MYVSLARGLAQQAPDRRNPWKHGVAVRNLPTFQHKEATSFSRTRRPNTPGFVTLSSTPEQYDSDASLPLGQVI